MGQILYASFADADMAERAVGALMDHGIKKEDISLIASESWVRTKEGNLEASTKDPVKAGQRGISTTTGADAAEGAKIGAGVGLGVGVLAALASLIVPGFGLVTGGGALATAILGAVGTTAGGAIAGGVTGFLKDQGMPEEAAVSYNEALVHGGALIAVTLPSGEVDQAGVRQILSKYNASNMSAYSPRA